MDAPSNSKRDQILKTGKDLFWKYGFKRVTIEEICKEAGVSKMTFYKFFPNKMALVKTIMDNIYGDSFTAYRNIMDSDLPYPEKVIQFIHLKQEGTKEMSEEFFRDFIVHADPETVEYFEQVKNRGIQMFMEDFSIAQKEGNIRKDVKVEFLIYYLNHMLELTHDEYLLKLYPTPQELILEITNFFFYGVLPHK